MRKINRTNEREHQGRLKSSPTGTFKTQLQQLRLLKTATKKRRALKKGRNKFRIEEIRHDVPRNLPNVC
jgi:hypothetical protein